MKKFKTTSLTLAMAGLLAGASPAFAQTWTALSNAYSAFTVAASADGARLIAACGDGNVRISTNSGASWSEYLGNATVVAVSADGNTFYAPGNPLDISTDNGASWAALTNLASYNYVESSQFIACSGDGSQLLVAHGSGSYEQNSTTGPLYSSPDYGNSWVTNTVPYEKWQCAAMSADGVKRFAAITGAGLFVSTNSGLNWVSNAAPNSAWTSLAATADASRLFAANNGRIYTSTNDGAAWFTNNAPNLSWSSVACSADGTKLVAAVGIFEGAAGGIYSSTNGGTTWRQNIAPTRDWLTVACSADGCRQFASGYDGQNACNTTLAPQPPSLKIANTGNSLMVCWTVQSTNVVLQTSGDLADWTNCPAIPTLNDTNLNTQVIIPGSDSAAFYRLQLP